VCVLRVGSLYTSISMSSSLTGFVDHSSLIFVVNKRFKMRQTVIQNCPKMIQKRIQNSSKLLKNVPKLSRNVSNMAQNGPK